MEGIVTKQEGDRDETAGEEAHGFAMTRAELRLTQWLAAIAGVLLVAAALWVWIPGDPPTIVRRYERTVTLVGGQGRRGGHRSRTVVVHTTRTKTGHARAGEARAAPPFASRRSEMLAAVLAGGGALLIFLGITLPRLRGGTLPNDTGVHFDPLLIVKARVRTQLAADSRLTREVGAAALDDVMSAYHRRGRWRRLADRVAGRPTIERRNELVEQTDRALAVRVPPPIPRTGDERYQGDRIEALELGEGAEIARLSFVHSQDGEEEHDILGTGEKLAGDTPDGQERLSRLILHHARGNLSVGGSAVARFADGYAGAMSERYWTIPLTEVLTWIDQNMQASGELKD